jgi:hypothetical protein
MIECQQTDDKQNQDFHILIILINCLVHNAWCAAAANNDLREEPLLLVLLQVNACYGQVLLLIC